VDSLHTYPHSICILAGDISPIDVITHIPVVCEDHKVPYVYVPSKEVRRGVGDREGTPGLCASTPQAGEGEAVLWVMVYWGLHARVLWLTTSLRHCLAVD
jgi:hypothetical protein